MLNNQSTPSAFFVAPSGKLFGRLKGELFYAPGDGQLHKVNIHRDDTAPSNAVTFSALNVGIEPVTVVCDNDVIEYAGESYALNPNYWLELPITRLNPDYKLRNLFYTHNGKFLLLCYNLAEHKECVYFDGKLVDVTWGKARQSDMHFSFDDHAVTLTHTEEDDGTLRVDGTIDDVPMEPLTLTDYAFRHKADGTIEIA